MIHLAGIAHDLSGKFQSQDYEKANFGLTSHYYDEFLKSKATSFIFMSSIKAAVDVSLVPVSEDVIPSPVTDYGKSKRNAEVHIETTPCPPEKHFYIFRPSMIYGRENKGNLNLLHRFIKSGIPYPLGAFENQRSFLFVENLNFIIEKFILNNYPSGIYHLADRKPLSTVELVKLMSHSMKKKAKIWMIPKSLTRLGARAGSMIGLPFNDQALGKLTESMVVSNHKVMQIIGTALPYDEEEGLEITVNSFHE